MPRGGKRYNKPGDPARPNRTDMNQPTPSRFYGDAVNQQRQLDAVPITPPPQPAATPRVMPAPSPPLPLDRPSERPGEPVTAGLPTGAGPGPEALGLGQNLEKLRPFLPVLELIASKPDAGQDARNFVRRLRGAVGTAPARPRGVPPGPQPPGPR